MSATFRTEIEALLSKYKTNEPVNEALSAAQRRYVIEVGLTHMRARMRAVKRRELLIDINPIFVKGKTSGAFEFSAETKRRMKERASRFFDVYPLTAKMMLGDATKPDLLERVKEELKSGKGHRVRAEFYQMLADPMTKNQKVRDVWAAEEAMKKYDDLHKKLLLEDA